jgi:hypothetical protein
MKNFYVVLISMLCLFSTGFALAQTIPSTGPRANHLGSGVKAIPTPHSPRNPNLKGVDKHLAQHMQKVHADLKAGRITKAQANAERDKVKAAHKQGLGFYKANGKKDLTDSQAMQVTGQVN